MLVLPLGAETGAGLVGFWPRDFLLPLGETAAAGGFFSTGAGSFFSSSASSVFSSSSFCVAAVDKMQDTYLTKIPLKM